MTAALKIDTRVSPAEYYRLERAAEHKSEYFEGEIFAMAGGTVRHSLLKTNTTACLHGALKKRGGGCNTYDSDLRVRIPDTGLRTYPDATVICGEPEIDPEDSDGETVINPTLIIEVLSDSTERYDRGTKFKHYQTIESLCQYVLVSQDQARVETYLRQSDGTWVYAEMHGLDAIVPISALGVSLPMAELYAGVVFPEKTVLRVLPKQGE